MLYLIKPLATFHCYNYGIVILKIRYHIAWQVLPENTELLFGVRIHRNITLF